MAELNDLERSAASIINYGNPHSCVEQVMRVISQDRMRLFSRVRKLQETAEVFNRSWSWVRRYLDMSKAVPEVLELLRERSITAVDALELSKLPAEHQKYMAVAMQDLTTKPEVRDYLCANLYRTDPKKLVKEPEPTAQLALGAKPVVPTPLEPRAAPQESRTAKQDCRLAVRVAFEALEPLFDKPMSHIITAFAGAPQVCGEFIQDAEEVRQMLGQIVAALKEQYGDG